ncbi:hypothetical protein DL96DRAFT_1715223 [Flagelloscypha sp. PMI_526]|nr:hypothetical protein DL96DRAFT_1715223 [Flagelloscypha sp. PMI_526]
MGNVPSKCNLPFEIFTMIFNEAFLTPNGAFEGFAPLYLVCWSLNKQYVYFRLLASKSMTYQDVDRVDQLIFRHVGHRYDSQYERPLHARRFHLLLETLEHNYRCRATFEENLHSFVGNRREPNAHPVLQPDVSTLLTSTLQRCLQLRTLELGDNLARLSVPPAFQIAGLHDLHLHLRSSTLQQYNQLSNVFKLSLITPVRNLILTTGTVVSFPSSKGLAPFKGNLAKLEHIFMNIPSHIESTVESTVLLPYKELLDKLQIIVIPLPDNRDIAAFQKFIQRFSEPGAFNSPVGQQVLPKLLFAEVGPYTDEHLTVSRFTPYLLTTQPEELKSVFKLKKDYRVRRMVFQGDAVTRLPVRDILKVWDVAAVALSLKSAERRD